MLVWHHNPHGKRAMHLDYASTFASVDETTLGWSRRQVAELVLQFEASPSSQRAFAQQMGIPRSTLQHWLKRKQTLDANGTSLRRNRLTVKWLRDLDDRPDHV